MVKALANHNKPPKIVEPRGELLDAELALYPEKYDWAEEQRVGKATFAIQEHLSPEIWKQLIEHQDDSDYWMTLADEAGAAEYGVARNYTVGDFCSELAVGELCLPIRRNLEILENDEENDDFGRLRYRHDLDAMRAGIPSKYAQRAFKELQLEACQRVIDSLPLVRHVSEKSKDEFRKKMQAEIDNVKKSKDGIFDVVRVFSGERYGRFNEELAATIREKYMKAGKPKELKP